MVSQLRGKGKAFQELVPITFWSSLRMTKPEYFQEIKKASEIEHCNISIKIETEANWNTLSSSSPLYYSHTSFLNVL